MRQCGLECGGPQNRLARTHLPLWALRHSTQQTHSLSVTSLASVEPT